MTDVLKPASGLETAALDSSRVNREEGSIGDASSDGSTESCGDYNPLPQNAPGAAAAEGHDVGNSIPLSIFPIAMDKFCICLVGLPGRGKTHIAHRLSRYLEFFHAMPTKLFNFSEYRRRMHGSGQAFLNR